MSTWTIQERPEGFEVLLGNRFKTRVATERAARHYVRSRKAPADRVYLVEDDGYRSKLASI
jgi:hypothetical protein